jgi:hypothetical protein
MRYTSCTYRNASASLIPFFEEAHGYETNGPVLSFFAPLASMETRTLGVARVGKDTCELFPSSYWKGVLQTLIVTFLAGGQGFTDKIESVADLRAHAKSIQGLKPIPSWLFSVLDNLEEEIADHPDEGLENYVHGNISESNLPCVSDDRLTK